MQKPSRTHTHRGGQKQLWLNDERWTNQKKKQKANWDTRIEQELITSKANEQESTWDGRGRLKIRQEAWHVVGQSGGLSKTFINTDGVSKSLAADRMDRGLQCMPGYGDTHRRGLHVVSFVVLLYPTCQNILFMLPLFISAKSRTVVMGSW